MPRPNGEHPPVTATCGRPAPCLRPWRGMLDNRSSHVGAPRPTQSRVTHDSVAGFLARGSSLPATFPGTFQFPVVSMTGDSPLTVAGAAAALCVETHAPHSLESIDPLREPPGTIVAGVWLTIRERRRGLIGQVCLFCTSVTPAERSICDQPGCAMIAWLQPAAGRGEATSEIFLGIRAVP